MELPITTSPFGLRAISTNQRNDLLKSVKQEHCIVVVGPYANQMTDGRLLKVHLAEYIAKQVGLILSDYALDDVIGRVLWQRDEEGNYYTAEKIRTFITNFYEELNSSNRNTDIFSEIIKLKSPIIFTTDPDKSFYDLYQREVPDVYGAYFDYTFDPPANSSVEQLASYFKPLNKGVSAPINPSGEKPLLLNLCGMRTDVQTLAVSPQEQIELLHKLASEEVILSVQGKTGDLLRQCNRFLFIGFNFNSWALAFVVHFINALMKHTKIELITLGFHVPKPNEIFDETKVLFYKNLRKGIVLDNQAILPFLRQLTIDLTPQPLPSRTLFVLCFLEDVDQSDQNEIKDSELFKSFLANFKLLAENSSLNLYITSNVPQWGKRKIEDDEIQEALTNSDLVLYLVSDKSLQDATYRKWLTQWQVRVSKDPNHTMVGLLDYCNWESAFPTSGTKWKKFWNIVNEQNPVLAWNDSEQRKKGTKELIQAVEQTIRTASR